MASSKKHEALPDGDTSFINPDDLAAFARAVHAPDVPEDDFITALNDWRPVHQRIRRKKTSIKKRPRRGKDETREGFGYQVFKWPLLGVVFTWIGILSILYVLTRFYISQYEYWVTWRGRREKLRKKLRSTSNYEDWKVAAKELDTYLGADSWKSDEAFAYYDYKTIKKATTDMSRLRQRAEDEAQRGVAETNGERDRKSISVVDELRNLVELCVKSNFGGIESFRLYSQTYYGTKDRVQEYVEEVEKSLKFLLETSSLGMDDKRLLFKHLSSNYGRTALCLSGGASFAYYHFGVVKAHLDADLLPTVITGTSGGALVAALVCTRTDEELKKLLVPALANKITACHDDTWTWFKRWWKTGARFDSVDWAERCCWFTRGSMTFKEAYERTGRILNISCIPSDPHSPSLLLNYLTAPDCCIFSAVLASAAVPGILNPVVLMTKTKSGTIAPFSFGHKWKDGSLRTDIPLKALNSHFNVNFSVVSQVNPHVSVFFFSSRGSVGRPVTHRRGKGWRGGFLGSAMEQYLKLDMAKWLKVLRHLELLPRPLSQDWSSVFLQKFDGNITIWPKTSIAQLRYILTDPTEERLENMLTVGQGCTFPKLKFVSNRLRIERLVDKGRQMTRSKSAEPEQHIFSAELYKNMNGNKPQRRSFQGDSLQLQRRTLSEGGEATQHAESPTARLSSWFSKWNGSTASSSEDGQRDLGPNGARPLGARGRRTSFSDTFKEIENQGRVFFDDSEEFTGSSASTASEEETEDRETKEKVGGETDDEEDGGEEEEEAVSDERSGTEKFQAGAMGDVTGVAP